MKKILLLTIIGICSSCVLNTKNVKIVDNIRSEPNQIQVNLPEKSGFVNDFENIFTASQKNELKTITDNYENEYGREFYIITTGENYGYEDYDELMGEFILTWEIGKKGGGNGVVILLSKKNRKFVITAGLEAEKFITHEKINEVVGSKVIPKLKENDFFGGTKNAVEAIIKIWE